VDASLSSSHPRYLKHFFTIKEGKRETHSFHTLSGNSVDICGISLSRWLVSAGNENKDLKLKNSSFVEASGKGTLQTENY
jgi:hypothetical protein